MKKNVSTLSLCLLIIALIPLVGCQAKPDAIAMKLAEATNAQDLDAALKLFAEDAVVNSGGPVPFTGKAEIQGWLEGMFADNFKIEVDILEMNENKVIERDTMTMDSVSALGITSLQGISEITVQDGKIKTLDFTFSDESLAELQVAMLNATTPTHADIPYHDDGDPQHTLDIYLPEGQNGPLPTLFILHGDDSTKEDFNFLAGYFVEQGYAAIATEFRSPAGDHIRDVSCSLAWVHANADAYGLDPQRIVVFGYSVGGLLSAMLGTVDDPGLFLEGCPHSPPESGWTQGVATYAAVLGTPEACLVESWCIFGSALAHGVTVDVMGGIYDELLDVPPSGWRGSGELSQEARDVAQGLPLYWLEGSEPPFLLIHGDADEWVPSGESEAFATYLEEAGVEAELLLIPGAGHLSIVPSSPSFFTIVEAATDFVADIFRE